MRYVILRDDDTNAWTPIECLERLYRPFLDRGLPVNLAVIPEVATNALTPEGKPEGFLFACRRQVGEPKAGTICFELAKEGCGAESWSAVSPHGGSLVSGEGNPLLGSQVIFRSATQSSSELVESATVPIGANSALVNYLRENAGYRVVQHGCHHDCFEFDRDSREEINARLEQGTRKLMEAGFPRPLTFVAPHDRFSRASYQEVAKRFRVISSGWFERRRLPISWWPEYLGKKARGAAHWHVHRTLLLSHPGCLLSARRDLSSMLDKIIQTIGSQRLTVLVTHWWEYFSDGNANDNFIRVLHRTAEYLSSQADIRVISFDDLTKDRLPLN